MPVLLDLLTEEVGRLYQGAQAPKWKDITPTPHDMKQMEDNSQANDTFDKDSLKHKVWTDYKNGTYHCVAAECEYGRVVALLPKGHKIPVESWGRIFQWFGRSGSNALWTVYWFGSAAKRLFPEHGHELGPGHVNGGYTFPCSTAGIFVYRLEEATRVLIHELIHAACLDPVDATLPVKEATVETWAELLLVAFRSKGSLAKASRLWKLQSEWVVSTNGKASAGHGVENDTDYAWRYLNGRIAIYRELGFVLPAPKKSKRLVDSTRFTHPILDSE